jgi:ATP-dependent RNA helicase DHX57
MITQMLIYSSLLDCVEPVLTIVASMSGKSPFLLPMDRKGEASNAHASLLFSYYTDSNLTKKTCFSDHLAIVQAFDMWLAAYRHEGPQAAYNFCHKKFLSHSAMLDIRELRENIRSHLVNAGFISIRPRGGKIGEEDEDSDSVNEEFSPTKAPIVEKVHADRGKEGSESSRNSEMNRILCAVCAGLSPNIFRLAEFKKDDTKKKKSKGSQKGKQKKAAEKVLKIVDGGTHTLSIDPPSLLQGKHQQVFDSIAENNADSSRRHGRLRRFKDAYFVYHKKVSTTDSSVSVYDCSVIPHAAVLLFGGDLNLNRSRDKVYVGDWIKMPVTELHAVLFKKLQGEVDSVLQCKVENPGADMSKRLSDLRELIDSVLADAA